MKFVWASIKICFSLLILFFGSTSVFSQLDKRTIKLSGAYFWGEGFGEDQQSSVKNAKRDLIERMIVRIESEASYTERDNIEQYSVELETKTSTVSRMELRGLNYLPAEKRRDGSWEAIAYISKKDFETTMVTEENRLLSSLSIALKDEEEGRLDSAIPQYMDLLATTFYFPVPFYATVSGSDTVELRAFLTAKLRNWLTNLNVEALEVRSLSTDQHSEFYFDIGIEYNSMKTSNLTLRLNKAGYASHTVRDGRTKIFYDLPPVELNKSFTFIISPFIPTSIDEEKQSILYNILPNREITLDINFSDVIDIDFDIIEEPNGGFKFIPEINNLGVYSIEWDFGDGETSTETSPIHVFDNKSSESIISLTVNGSANLSKKKRLTEHGKLSHLLNPKNADSPIESQRLTTSISNDANIGYSIPMSQKTYLDNVIRLTDGQSLTRYLNQLANRKVLEIGRKSDVSNPLLSFLAIINPQNRRVIAILSSSQNGIRFNIVSNETIFDQELASQYKGMGSVWFQFK